MISLNWLSAIWCTLSRNQLDTTKDGTQVDSKRDFETTTKTTDLKTKTKDAAQCASSAHCNVITNCTQVSRISVCTRVASCTHLRWSLPNYWISSFPVDLFGFRRQDARGSCERIRLHLHILHSLQIYCGYFLPFRPTLFVILWKKDDNCY